MLPRVGVQKWSSRKRSEKKKKTISTEERTERNESYSHSQRVELNLRMGIKSYKMKLEF